MNVRFRIFNGPNIHAPFAAIIADFENPFGFDISPLAVEATWRLIDDEPLWDKNRPQVQLSFANVAAALAVKIQHPEDEQSAQVRIVSHAFGGTCSISIGFLDPVASRMAVHTAIVLAESIFLAESGEASHPERQAGTLSRARVTLRSRLPQAPIVRTLIREARKQGIPVYPVAEGSRVWQFGQGAAGIHFLEAGSDRDSFTGMNLARDKTWANRLVGRLGFPGVTHAVAMREAEAIRIAAQYGYPVVVKPRASGKGKGVSAYVVEAGELRIAFAEAAALSPQGVLVERHVAGVDHRLAVFGGTFSWVVARYPANVVGDGRTSIADLIERENLRRREDAQSAEAGLIAIEPDQEMLRHLEKQGFSLATRPREGLTVNLRSVANVSRGGSIVDVTHRIHPDNRDMAEAIARGFRMDALGVDFLTPDISRSWRDVPCAVIEVNGTPGILFDSRAAKILHAKFPAGSAGRVPSVLLVNPPASLRARMCEAIGARGRAAGHTDAQATFLGGHVRCGPDEDLAARVSALVSDPGCEALIIETSVREVATSGLPLDRFDLGLSFEPLPMSLREVVMRCSRRYIDSMSREVSEATMNTLLDEAFLPYENASPEVR